MRIGILTFHRAINYGAVLQCHALYKVLADMGHDVEVIDYRPESIERYRMYFRTEDFRRAQGLGKARYLLSCISLIASKKRTVRNFDGFIGKYLKTSGTVRAAGDMPRHYEMIFFGSDQIWSPEHCEGLDKIYCGQFSKGTTRFVTYAVSVGRVDLIKQEEMRTLQKWLRVFDRISVRERQLAGFLAEYCGYKPTLVCDPTLLQPEQAYLAMAKMPREKNYVLLFDLTNEQGVYQFARRIAHQLQAEVISLKALINPFRKKSYIRGNISPGEFVGYLKYARCVITNSFHATSFSVIFRKDFYTLLRDNNNDRAKSFLGTIGLSDRLVPKDETVEYSSVGYSAEVLAKLEDYRIHSMSYITDSMELCKMKQFVDKV